MNSVVLHLTPDTNMLQVEALLLILIRKGSSRKTSISGRLRRFNDTEGIWSGPNSGMPEITLLNEIRK